MKTNRFIIWRREPHELHDVGSLAEKLFEAKQMIEDGEHDAVVIVEVKKVVEASKKPVVVRDY
jgi:ATP:corrinoid adenosyltransferase